MWSKLIMAIVVSTAAFASVPIAAAVPTPLPQICIDGPAPSSCMLPGDGRIARENHAHGNLPYASVVPTIVISGR
jgi:hypothetical protein